MPTLRDIAVQLLTMSAAALVWFAHQWDTTGFGLNPWIALPAASLVILLPHLVRSK